VTATAIAAGQGDLSDRDFIRDLQERIEETQRALDLALKDMRPSLDRSPTRMRELLKRPTADYEAAARAEIHKSHLKAALSLSYPSTTNPVQDTQARNTKSPDRTTDMTQKTAEQIPLAVSKKRGRVPSSTSTDSANPPKAKRRKTAAAPRKERRKPWAYSSPTRIRPGRESIPGNISLRVRNHHGILRPRVTMDGNFLISLAGMLRHVAR
jgi:hypothetical protein